MKMNEILATIKTLSIAQGFYCRLYQSIIDCKNNDIERYNKIKQELEHQNFKDSLDLVFYFEC